MQGVAGAHARTPIRRDRQRGKYGGQTRRARRLRTLRGGVNSWLARLRKVRSIYANLGRIIAL